MENKFKKYIGTKMVETFPMDAGEACDEILNNILNKIVTPECLSTKEKRAGYIVKYKDGYMSWSPKEVFEESYKPYMERVEKDDFLYLIENTQFYTVGKKTTVCCLTLKNGFEVIGTSACVKACNFNAEIGREFAYDNALEKLWQLEGYRLQAEIKIGEEYENARRG